MRKSQRIKALEEIVETMGRELGFSIEVEWDGTVKVGHLPWNPPIAGWRDERIQTLLRHLGIAHIEKPPIPEQKYEVGLISKTVFKEKK